MNKVEASVHQLIISMFASVFATVCTSRSWRFTPADKEYRNTITDDKLILGSTPEITRPQLKIKRESNYNENVKPITEGQRVVCIHAQLKE